MEFSYSLLAKTLKAKYYPNTDFMRAELGNYPSYTWVVGNGNGNWLLQDGMTWVVGNGNCNSIWQDPWVPKLEKKRIQESVRNNSVNQGCKQRVG